MLRNRAYQGSSSLKLTIAQFISWPGRQTTKTLLHMKSFFQRHEKRKVHAFSHCSLSLFAALLLGVTSSGLAQEISKTNSTPGNVNGGTITRTVDVVSGVDLPVGTTISDINLTITWNRSIQFLTGFGNTTFHEETGFWLTSPNGTRVVVVYDVFGLHSRSGVIPATYGGVTPLAGDVTVEFDQQATSSPGTSDFAGKNPISTSFKPEGTNALDNLDNYNGESPFGTWTLTIADGLGSGGFGEVEFKSFTLTVNKSNTPDMNLSFQNGTSSASETGGSATVVATLSAAAASDVTVNLGFSGTATNNTDFTASTSAIVITAGDLSGTSTLNFSDDGLDETDESIIVDISSVSNANEGSGNQIIATITDDDLTTSVASRVYLEGAFNGTNLNTTLNANIPVNQPYTNNGHAGGESAGSPPAAAVDWVLVELREAGSAAAATGSTRVGSAAGFLMSDGSVKATDGTSDLTITAQNVTGSSFFVVVYHRNHLSLMSASAITESGGKYSIDFTTAQSQAFGTNPMIEVASGVFAMAGGDADGDGDIDAADLLNWRNQNGTTFVYNTSKADFNLDGVVNAVDRNDFQQKNNTKTSQVPGI